MLYGTKAALLARFCASLPRIALVVQWIELRTPNAMIQVRFLARALVKTVSAALQKKSPVDIIAGALKAQSQFELTRRAPRTLRESSLRLVYRELRP